MEPHKELDGTEEFRPSIEEGPVEYFRKAWAFALKFYQEEVSRISSVRLENVDPDFFFREYVWVVHATGFSAKAVGKFMPRLMQAYGGWADLGKMRPDQAVERVKPVCNNPLKIKAVWKTARMMEVIADGTVTWEKFREAKLSDPAKLAELPYVGKVTCYHLGRNIGLLESVKPDLHLVRMAEHWGFRDCVDMCTVMRAGVDPSIPLGIVDLALWYAASTFGTLEIRKAGQR